MSDAEGAVLLALTSDPTIGRYSCRPLPKSRIHIDRLGMSTLSVNDERRDLLGRINCGSCSIDAR